MINNRSYIAGILSLTALFWGGIVPCAQALTWDVFSSSVSTTITEGTGFSLFSFLSLILIILVLSLIILVLSLSRFQKANTQRLISDNQHKKWNESTVALSGGETPQKRMHYRLRTDASIKWLPLKNAYYANPNVDYVENRLWDMSAGGLSFVTQDKLGLGDKLRILFDYGENIPLKLDGSVTRLEEIISPEPQPNNENYEPEPLNDADMEPTYNDDDREPTYNVGIKFNSILEDEREIIIAWITERQRTNIIVSQFTGTENQSKDTEDIPVEDDYRISI